MPEAAEDGESLGITVSCDRENTNREAFDPEYTYRTAWIYLDEPKGGPLSRGELLGGGRNPAEYCVECFMGAHMSFGQPVDAPTGNFWHSFTDLTVPGRGFGLALNRTYNSGAAAANGPFGYGWSYSYGTTLSFPNATHVLVTQENGSQVEFEKQPNGTYSAPARVIATLAYEPNGTWRLVRRATETLTFNTVGQLASETDRNGYTTTLYYNEQGQLETVTDPAGRKLTFAYEGAHIVHVTDPAGRGVSYTYDPAGDVTDVTDVSGGVTHFTYDTAHRLLTMRTPDQAPSEPDATGASLTNNYDSSGRVVEQTDQLGRRTTFAYEGEPLGPNGGSVTVTDPRGNQVSQRYQWGELLSETRGANSFEAQTWSFEYDSATFGVTRITDPNGHSSQFTYDAGGNLLTSEDPLARRTRNTYDAHNDLLSTTDPMGVTTTMTYDARGNWLTRSRPLAGTSKVQTTTDTYGDSAQPGDVTEEINPDGQAWKYFYDEYGDRVATADPLGRKTTATYNTDGWRLSTTTPRGFTTTYNHNAFGKTTETTDPLGHTSTNEFDADQNLTSSTDADGHVTQYSYDAADERIAVHRADGSTLRTTYWPDGTIKEQIDGAGNVTKYDYNAFQELESVTDPLGRVTHHSYDRAGNETEERQADGTYTTKYYDAANELTTIYYSDGKTPSVTGIAYNGDGDRTAETDGAGERTFTYDSLGRLTATVDGSGAQVGYEYDLVGHITKLTYPNGKSVSREYNAAGELTGVTDWLGHTTRFGYDKESNVSSREGAGGVDEARGYDNTDRLTEIEDANGSGTLASFGYMRDANGQVTEAKDENGEASTTSYTYDALDRLTAANYSEYNYDTVGNPIGFGPNTTQVFDAANQLTTRTEPGLPDEAPEESKETESKETKGSEPPPSGSERGTPKSPGTSGGSGGGSVVVPPGGGGVAGVRYAYAAPVEHAVGEAASRHSRTLTSARVRTSEPNDLLLALITASGPARQTVSHVTAKGLRWSRIARKAGAGGVVELWDARASQSFNGTVTAQLRARGYRSAMTVLAFNSSSYVADQTASLGRRSAPSLAMSPSREALIIAVGHSTGQKVASSPSGGAHLLASFFDRASRSAGWIQVANGLASRPRLTETTPAAQWSLLGVAIESRVAVSARVDGAAATQSPTASPSTTMTAPVQAPIAQQASHAPSHAAATEGGTAIRKYAYGARGDRTGDSTGGVSRTLSYNAADELIGIAEVSSYAYNGDGLRTSKSVGGTTTNFVWNEAEPVPALLAAGETYYVYGPDEEPIEQITESTAYFLHQDQQGSTRLITNTAGAVVDRYNYDAWGNITSHTGEVTTDLQYNGQYTDTESGYQYLRARYYDPATGQFLTVDPAFASTQSAYGYSANDPVNESDPLGRWSFSACFGVCIGYTTSQGWGGGFGLGGGVTVGHVSVGGGTSTIAYPHTGEISWSGGLFGVGGEIDVNGGHVVGGDVCAGVDPVSICGPPDWGGSNSTYKQANPLPLFEHAHSQYQDQYLKPSAYVKPGCYGSSW